MHSLNLIASWRDQWASDNGQVKSNNNNGWEISMGSFASRQVTLAHLGRHPKCSVCGVPMWLIQIKHVSGDPKLTRNRYECQACDAVAILPPLSSVATPLVRRS